MTRSARTQEQLDAAFWADWNDAPATADVSTPSWGSDSAFGPQS